MKRWVLSLALAIGANAQANSYVGNGGGQGDIELSVTLMQIRETFTAIDGKREEKVNLCSCNKAYEGRATCEPLNSLTDEQTKFCNQSLAKLAPEVLKLVNNYSNIHFNWTHDRIEVNEDGQSRAVDAVTNRAKREITINQDRFLDMRPADRVFLLTHELMHLTSLDGKPLVDRGEVGPFKGEDGSRGLINAMAASAGVMQGAYPKEIKSYRAKLSRSQSSKTWWFGLDYGGGSPTAQYDDKFQLNQYQSAQAFARVQWTRWGLELRFRGEFADGSVQDTIKTHEEIYTLGFGPTYRFFMSGDPLSFWGQSHIMIHALAEIGQGRYNYREESAGVVLGGDDRTDFFGANVGVRYYIPLFWGLWVHVGGQYEYHPYKYAKEASNTLNYNKNLVSGNIGVSYAF